MALCRQIFVPSPVSGVRDTRRHQVGEKVCVHRFAHSQQQTESWRGENKGESEQLGAVELEGAAVDKEPEVLSRRGTVAGSRWRCLLHGGRWVPVSHETCADASPDFSPLHGATQQTFTDGV